MTGAERGEVLEHARELHADPALSTRLDSTLTGPRWCVTSKRLGWRPLAGHHETEDAALMATSPGWTA